MRKKLQPLPDYRGDQARQLRAVGKIIAALTLAHLPTVAFAESACPGIHVEVPNLKNSSGSAACAIFESSDGFPREFLRSASMVMIQKVREAQASCDFINVPPGRYAIAVIHDENVNGELDTNWLGIPTEGYGFSKTTIEEFGAPAFSAASFQYDGSNLALIIKLKY